MQKSCLHGPYTWQLALKRPASLKAILWAHSS
jgi:hypothetical protein